MEPGGDLASTLSAISSSVVALTRSANQVAAGDIGFQRGLTPSFGDKLDRQNARLLALTERLLGNSATTTEAVRPRLPDEDAIEGNWRGIVDVLDSLLERADISLDEFSGAIKRFGPGGEQLAPSPSPSRPSKIPAALRSQDLVKPQLAFDHPWGNQETGPFRPLLESKPHAIVPLEESLRLNTSKDGTTQHHPHPYRTEIEQYEYPAFVYTRAEPVPYPPFESTSATFIDTEEGVEEMLEELEKAQEIAVDLEHHDTRSYVGIVSLMQISTRNRDWIVDTLKPWRRKLSRLNRVFADPNILKVFHGAHMDIVWLQRDLGLYVVGLFDTHFAARALGYSGGSLAFLLKKFVNVDAQKQFQMADWRIRPLPQELLDYARSDTHYLLYIYDNVRNELLNRSSLALPNKEHDMLYGVWKKSKEVSLQLYSHPKYDAERGLGQGGWYKLLGRNPAVLSKEQFCVFLAVHEWRDKIAREQDDGLHYVLLNSQLFAIAKNLPTDQAKLFSVAQPLTQTVKLRAAELLAVIASAREKASDAKEMREVLRDIEIFIHGEPLVEVTPRKGVPLQDNISATQSKTVTTLRSPLSVPTLRSAHSSFWGPMSSMKRSVSMWHPTFSIPLPPSELLPLDADSRSISNQPGTTNPLDTPTRDVPESDVFTLRSTATKRKADVLSSATADTLAAQSDEVDLGDADLMQQQAEKKRRKAERKAAKRAKRASEVRPEETLEDHDYAAIVGEIPQLDAFKAFDYGTAPTVLHAQANDAASNAKDKKDRDKNGKTGKAEPFGFAKGLNDVAKGLGRRQKERAGKSMTFRD